MVRIGRRVLSRQDRHKTRQQLGPLRDLMMTANMKKRYDAALNRYFDFERLHSFPAPMDYADVDATVASYVEQLWQEGDPRYWAEDTVSGFTKMIPSIKGSFRLSWALITAWQRNEPPRRCTPLTMDILLAMVGRAVTLGWHRLGLLLLLGFHCILRTAEMYSVRVGDFEFDKSLQRGVLTLRESKSGTRYNMVESVTIDDANLVVLWSALLADVPRGELVYPEGAHSFRRCFDQLVSDVGLPFSLYYKPYSIRRGAATADFLSHGLLSRTCVRGRWANERTCRIYVNEASSTLSHLRFSSSTTRLMAKYRKVAISSLASSLG